ncbi:putative MFS family arabinose efflux permease [Variovorax boronicumulans]|uniref:MFS family arabinose efflux permease n=1 Tax=Variovorax boronicumulans TaxID=436515 RepID=A0AAW8D138_9BURK|nr:MULTISPECIES: MFS transporter [Variovorax]MDP9892940.1 putative MFS family arabinose efflux permease [Variovorax boronicumulans]MDP9991020.1 putative MFS family arabinose efflux permease [Variovorax boronicumulans]MDQ0003048.1 putative MFS family arabinose efflux permease [Variovorax boronicumulans]MDQ0037935.1 putative MFS family arabinose efflux permease [Variovorax boronicumulans]MDQ0052713.1 putative MFS family arabinose efflux permease [Variovorax boronicumulans]
MVVVTAGTRWASRAQFFSSGFIFATWGVHVPTVKAHYGLDEAQLGLALLAAGAGAMFGLTSAGRWIGRHGPRRIAVLSGCVYALLLAGLIAMPGYFALMGLLAAFGLVTSVFDVAINTEAAQLEMQSGTPLMSGMHGMFSLGGMAGAASGSAVLAAGMGAQTHLLLVAAVMVLLVALSSTRMLPKAATGNTTGADHSFRLPRGPLAVLGVLAALGLIAEGAIYDWSVLYMQQELGSPQKQAALAYAAFSAAMAAARFGGDAMRARFTPVALLRGSGVLAAAAMTLVLLTDLPWLALVGFAGVGVGFANVVPILFGASARVPGVEPASGIASVSAVAYLGFMAGPAVIGLLARASSLTAALYVVVIFAAALAASARFTRSEEAG